MSDPGDRPPRPDAEPVARGVPGLLHHRRRQQRRNRIHQRVDRTRPPRRQRVPRPRQLPPQNAPHRRRSTTMTPRSGTKSREWYPISILLILPSQWRWHMLWLLWPSAPGSPNLPLLGSASSASGCGLLLRWQTGNLARVTAHTLYLHSALNYRTPNEAEQDWYATNKAA